MNPVPERKVPGGGSRPSIESIRVGPIMHVPLGDGEQDTRS